MDKTGIVDGFAGQERSNSSESSSLYVALKWIMLSLLVTRGSLDHLLGSLQFTILGLPVGALLNLMVIVGAILLCILTYPQWRGAIGVWWFLFLALSLISLTYTPIQIDAARTCAALATNLGMLVLPFAIANSERDIRLMMTLLFVSAIIPLVGGLPELTAERAESTFPHPNVYGFYLGLISLTALAAFSWKGFFQSRFVLLALIVLVASCGIMLIATKSRGAWFGLAAAFTIFAALYKRQYLGLLALLPLLLFVPSVQERIFELNAPTEYVGDGLVANSYVWRELLWRSAYGWFIEEPLTGYGVDSFSAYSLQFFPWGEGFGYNAHNVYVQAAFELGVLGPIFYVLIFVRLLLISWRARSSAPEAASLLTAIAVYYILLSYSDNLAYYLSFNWYYWFLVGSLHRWIQLRSPRDAVGA